MYLSKLFFAGATSLLRKLHRALRFAERRLGSREKVRDRRRGLDGVEGRKAGVFGKLTSSGSTPFWSALACLST